MIREADVTRVIIEHVSRELQEVARSDVIVVGAGPSGMTTAYYLARSGWRVVVLERRLCFGGGIGGGAMLLPRVVVEEEALKVLHDIGLKPEPTRVKGLYVVDPSTLIAYLAKAVVDSGAKILLGVEAVDLVVRKEGGKHVVKGVMVQWSAVSQAGFHVDPLMLESEVVVDATGHEARLVKLLSQKLGVENLRVQGEGPCWVEEGERLVVEATGEVYPGLFAVGMAASALKGYYRMGPVFGGMLLSGLKAAQLIDSKLRKAKG